MRALDLIGYIGAVLTLGAFFNVSHGRWQAQSLRYQATNLVAGIILAYYVEAKHAYVNILLNVVWSAVAIYGLRIAHTHGKRRAASRRRSKT